MAKSQVTKLREEERTVETLAAYAGGGDRGDSGSMSMPGVEKDRSLSMAQSAVDSARSYNEGDFGTSEPGEASEVY